MFSGWNNFFPRVHSLRHNSHAAWTLRREHDGCVQILGGGVVVLLFDPRHIVSHHVYERAQAKSMAAGIPFKFYPFVSMVLQAHGIRVSWIPRPNTCKPTSVNGFSNLNAVSGPIRWMRAAFEPREATLTPDDSGRPFYRRRCRQSFMKKGVLMDDRGVTFSKNSKMLQNSLLYAQLYNASKGILAAGNAYPFANAAIDSLALGGELVRSWQHVGQAMSHSPQTLLKAYLHCNGRISRVLEASSRRSFGVRKEYRVGGKLLDEIDIAMRAGPVPPTADHVSPGSSFLAHATPTFLDFLPMDREHPLPGRQPGAQRPATYTR